MIFRSINKLLIGAPVSFTKTVMKGAVEGMVSPLEDMVHPVKSMKKRSREKNCTIIVKVKRR